MKICFIRIINNHLVPKWATSKHDELKNHAKTQRQLRLFCGVLLLVCVSIRNIGEAKFPNNFQPIS